MLGYSHLRIIIPMLIITIRIAAIVTLSWHTHNHKTTDQLKWKKVYLVSSHLRSDQIQIIYGKVTIQSSVVNSNNLWCLSRVNKVQLVRTITWNIANLRCLVKTPLDLVSKMDYSKKTVSKKALISQTTVNFSKTIRTTNRCNNINLSRNCSITSPKICLNNNSITAMNLLSSNNSHKTVIKFFFKVRRSSKQKNRENNFIATIKQCLRGQKILKKSLNKSEYKTHRKC